MSPRLFPYPFPDYSDGDKPFDDFFSTFYFVLKSIVALLVLGTGFTFLMIYVVYRCLKKHGLPSINIKTTAHGGASTAAEHTSQLPDSMIRDTTIENFLDEIAREKPIRFTSQQLEGYTQRRSAELGAGGFGAVYKGMLPNGLDVAVKVLHEHMDSEVTEQQFMAEVRTLWGTNHANLIRLIGFCYDGAIHALVYEFMARRSLDKYLFDRKRRAVVGPAALLAIAGGVARGLRYLHEECQKKIVHYDVKASNVLLDESLTAKLTDFVIAQLLSRADGVTHAASVHDVRGTFGYMAPEVIHVGTAPVTEKCDVYSFGMLLFEVVGRRKNMDNSAPESHRWLPLLAWTLYQQDMLLDLVKECHCFVPAAAAADEGQWKVVAERMCKVAFLCVQEKPEARPTMSAVASMLEGHLEIPAPVYPFGWMYSQRQEASQQSASSSTSDDDVIVRVKIDR